MTHVVHVERTSLVLVYITTAIARTYDFAPAATVEKHLPQIARGQLAGAWFVFTRTAIAITHKLSSTQALGDNRALLARSHITAITLRPL